MKRILALLTVGLLSFSLTARVWGQSLGNAGTVSGTVTDPSGAAIANATVTIVNRITNYRQTATADSSGVFRFNNIPPNPYHLEVSAPNFASSEQDVDVRSTVPINLKVQLALAGTKTTVTVEAAGADLLENVPYAHNDIDRNTLTKLPITSPASGLSDAIMLASGAVAADSNGFFHPLGDHAQTSFSIDGQPISDQQSKQFSTQIPLDVIQSMELITGAPPAEFGDKTSLIVNAVTRSGLGQKTTGSLMGQWGSFATYSEEATLGFGNKKAGNFLAFNTLRSGRFLDTPEFTPIHAIGNTGTAFDRFDYQPTSKDAFHVNLYAARNWFQIPNTYDQLGQDQRQRITTFNFAPGYQHTFGATTLVTINPFYRVDHVHYYPSADPLDDSPATLAQNRSLTNWGVKADVSYASGRHNLKVGTQIMQTRLDENFSLGITDPTFNAVCVDKNGDPQELPNITDPKRCVQAGFLPNPDVLVGLIAFDLTRGGNPFQFKGKANINQFAFYLQDAIKFGNLTVQAGLRIDRYNGITSDTGVQPRIGLSYLIPKTGTVLRASYARTFETPYNENLIVSSKTGAGGLAENVFGAFGSEPLRPGNRNQFNAGFQQGIGRWLVADADYFWKYTDRAYDFGVLLNTPVQFPIEWRKSKIDGIAVRISTPNLHGFQWYTTMGHTRSRYFGPEVGGLIFNSPLDTSVFRIDHDQAFQQTTTLRYQRGAHGPWITFTWRYDSGLVAGAVTTLDDALGLTAAEQAAIGFFCGNQRASLYNPITSCNSSDFGATRLVIPKEGTADPDHNPPRVAPRHLFDVGAGTDNLFHTERVRTTLRFVVRNIANKEALYNFLSTFSGTHFVAPRTYQAAIGLVF
jgi:Carboxypeptidase regulatory-like domain